MFGVSLLYTMAYAFSITRYKLMQVEEIINRSAVYFAFSLTAGLIYSGLLLVSGKLIGDQLFSTHSTSRGAVVAALSVIVVLIFSEVVARAVSAGDRPAVLPREVQVRSGDAEDAAGGGQPDRPRDAGPPAARGGGRGACGWNGGRSTWATRRADRSSWWPATAPRPTSEPCRRIIRWSIRLRQTPAVRLSHAWR